MRLSDLTELECRDESGNRLGRVWDVRFAGTSEDQRWTVHGLVVGRQGIAGRLGYGHGRVKGPWLLGAAMRWFTRHGRYVAWDHVLELTADRVVVSVPEGGHPHPWDERARVG